MPCKSSMCAEATGTLEVSTYKWDENGKYYSWLSKECEWQDRGTHWLGNRPKEPLQTGHPRSSKPEDRHEGSMYSLACLSNSSNLSPTRLQEYELQRGWMGRKRTTERRLPNLHVEGLGVSYSRDGKVFSLACVKHTVCMVKKTNTRFDWSNNAWRNYCPCSICVVNVTWAGHLFQWLSIHHSK